MTPPRPPWTHRILGHHYTLVLYRLVGSPNVTVRWSNCVTRMERLPNGVTKVSTTKAMK